MAKNQYRVEMAMSKWNDSAVKARFLRNPPWRSCSRSMPIPNVPRKNWKPMPALSPESERILVFDFGAQYAQLIARRVRDLNVFCQLVRFDVSADRIAQLQPKGIILSGGPASVYEPRAPKCDPGIFDLDVPVLGICYGMQLACQALGGHVAPAAAREFGRADLTVTNADALFRGYPTESTVWMSHGDQVQTVA